MFPATLQSLDYVVIKQPDAENTESIDVTTHGYSYKKISSEFFMSEVNFVLNVCLKGESNTEESFWIRWKFITVKYSFIPHLETFIPAKLILQTKYQLC